MGLLELMRLPTRAAARQAEDADAGETGCRFTIVNHGASTIAAIHARPFGARAWGRDLLGGHMLRAGEERTVLASGTTRRWDLSIEYSCGAGHFLRGMALSQERQLGVTEFGVRTF